MGKSRENPEAGLLVRSYAVTHPASLAIDRRTLEWDQLAYASKGVMTVDTDDGTWVVPPHRAVWIPAGEAHRIEMSGQVSVRTLFFRRGLAEAMTTRCRAVNVTPLLRELILHAIEEGLLWNQNPPQRRLAFVILDQLQVLDAIPLQLPMPQDPRAKRAAQRILTTLAEAPSLDEVAREVGASRRTLERLFLQNTAMSLGRWRQRARLVASLRRLAAGVSITEVALDVGYASPSAFIAAFSRQLGATPGRYFEGGAVG